jgi:hypothetical protein
MTDDLSLAILAGAIRLAVAAIFLVGALHKLRDANFVGIVAAYRLAPAGWASPLARALPLLELAAAVFLLWPAGATIAIMPALILLIATSAALAINLARGRSDLDCGCGGIRGQGISWAMVLRNGVVVLLLLSAARPIALPPLGIGGLLLMLATATALTGFHFTASQLLVNARRWQQVA